VVSNDGICFFNSTALGSITKACKAVIINITEIIIAEAIAVRPLENVRQIRATVPQANPQRK